MSFQLRNSKLIRKIQKLLVKISYFWVSSKFFRFQSDHHLFYLRLWRNEVAYKKRERAAKRKEMEILMKDNLLNILTVPGTPIR